MEKLISAVNGVAAYAIIRIWSKGNGSRSYGFSIGSMYEYLSHIGKYDEAGKAWNGFGVYDSWVCERHPEHIKVYDSIEKAEIDANKLRTDSQWKNNCSFLVVPLIVHSTIEYRKDEARVIQPPTVKNKLQLPKSPYFHFDRIKHVMATNKNAFTQE